jgi:alkanesulfonate monooxygenase SsuD/methylene tetrahydromethanopterin reductase-like flavin-dependent oxidoreductase (luciferase family)
MALVGTSKQVIARIKALEAVGVQETVMWPFPRKGEEVEDLLIRLAHDVLPYVAERPKREAYRLVD